MTEIKQLNW